MKLEVLHVMIKYMINHVTYFNLNWADSVLTNLDIRISFSYHDDYEHIH